MTEPKSFDELISAWKRLSDEYLAGFRQAFEAGATAAFGAATSTSRTHGTPPAEDVKEPRATEEEPAAKAPGAEQPGTEAEAGLAARVDSLDERVRRLEQAISALAEASLDDDDDEDDELEERLEDLEARVEKLLRKARKRKK